MKSKTRSYRLKQRAESQEWTRQKIVDAAIELHQARGLAATTLSDVAERANVGKVTVYRHFPNATALLNACSGQYFEQHPFPDIEGWRRIADPTERLRQGLRDTYAFHRATEPMMARIYDEARELPVMEPYHAHWARAVDVLAAPWPVSGRRKTLLKALLALALSYETWRLLVRSQGLSDTRALNLMMGLTGIADSAT